MLEYLLSRLFGCRHTRLSSAFRCQRDGTDGKVICAGAGTDEVACLACGAHLVSAVQFGGVTLPPIKLLRAEFAEPKLTALERMRLAEELQEIRSVRGHR